MPIYKVNGKTYDIPEEKVARFETAYPDAVVGIYDGGTGKEYEMPVSKVDKFKKAFPEWSYSRPVASGTSSGEGQEADSPGMAAVTDNVGTSGDERESTSGNKEGWKPTPIQKAFMMGSIQSSLDRFKAQSDASLERAKNVSDYYRRGGAFSGNKPVKGDMRYNPEKGQVEQTYLTPTGTSTADRFAAEQETRAFNDYVDNMTVSGQLRRAGRELTDLHRKRDERVQALHEKWKQDQEKNTAPLAAVLGAQTYRPSIESDPEYRSLTAAIHQAEKRVQTLQHENDRQEGKDVGFWRGFGEVVGDIKTWDFGYSGLMDAMTMLDATSKPSSNRRPKTDAQKEAEQTMLEQAYKAQEAQASYGQNDSFWNRAGVMTGEMLPFMLDFAIMGGAKSGSSLVTRNLDAILLRSLHKAAPKVARNKAVQWTTKALGAMPEDLLYRAPLMTNTVQGMKTSADIIDRKLGDVVVRDDGTYDFSNDKTWGSAVWQGEANAIIENYSEMFGTHLEGVLSLKTVGKIADTFGAKRLSGILTKASNSELAGIAGTMQKHLNRLGVSDYFGEVGEEYYGQLWRTMLNLDDAYKPKVDAMGMPVYKTDKDGNILKDEKGNPIQERENLFLDGQFHGDVWGGMALSMGLMGAGKYSISAAAYGSMKHRVNKTDTRASEIFTPEVWDGWRERIDGTTNDKIGEIAESIVADPTLTDEQRTAAMNYMEASLNLRGFNLASVARQRGGEMSEDEAAANESYMDGYSASTPQEMNDAKKMLDLQRGRLASALSEDLVQDFDNDPIGALSVTHDPELRVIAADYVNAKMVYDGMIQRVRDDIDGRIARSDAMIDSRINRETGMLQPATVRDVDSSDGRRVYIVNGSVAKYDDGTGVDARKSSESIIIRDAETGKVEFADPAQFLGVDEAIDAETEKAAAREQIRREVAQVAANNIDGVLSFTPGDSYSILDAEGNQQPVTVLGNSVDEEGLPVDGSVDVQYADGTIQSVVTSELQQMVDAASSQRVEQYDREREAQRAAADEAARQADQSGLTNPNRRTDLMPDDYKTPYDNRPVRATRYIESENGTGGTLYQDENGNDAVVIAAIDNNNYVGYFREYDEQGNPTNQWSAKFQNGSGLRENHRDMMLTAQELLPAGHELTEHTSVSTDGLRNLANQLKHGYELQYDEHGNIVTTEVAVNMMARDNTLGLSDYEPGSIDPARVSSEEYKEAASRLIPYMEALGLSKFNIHWEDGTMYVDHPILKRADTPQQAEQATVPENAETVPNPSENAVSSPSEAAQPITDGETVAETVSTDDGFIPIDPEIKPDENGVIDVSTPVAVNADAEISDEEPKLSALSRVPTDESGEPIYERAEPDTAWDALVEQTEGDEDIAMEVVSDIVAEKENDFKAAEKAFKKVKEGKPEAVKGEGKPTMAERIAAKRMSKDALAKAQEELDHAKSILERWQLIAGTRQRRIDAEKNAALKEQQQWEEAKSRLDKRVRETSEKYRDLPEVMNILEQTDPQSIDEVAAWVLSRYKVLWGSRRNQDTGNVVRAGVQQHTGIGEGERRKLFGLFASEANGGRSIESLAEDVFEEACSQFGVPYDNGQALDALIDVIKGASSRSDITNYIINNRIAQAESEGDAIHRNYEDAEAVDREYHERYGMSESEWVEFSSAHDNEIGLPDDEYQELMINLGGLKADEEYERGEIQEPSPDTSGESGEDGIYSEGSGVGPEGWVDYDGDASRREEERGAPRGELVQDSVDEGSGGENEITESTTESVIQTKEDNLRSRIEVKDDDWTEGGGYTPTLKRTVVIDGTHNVTQVDAPNDKGDYTGSIFEYEGKTFGDLREVISYIDSSQPATIGERIAEAEAEVNTNPTDGQKKAGNYKKGHVQVGTFDVTIENPKGSKRSGTDADGKKWETTMTHTYGYIRGTKGVDGDHIDVYISSDIDGWNGRKVFVVDQYNPDGSFDEHKVMLGFNDKDEAFEAYLSNYEAGWEKGRRLDVTAVNLDDFEKWIESSKRKTKAFAEYKRVRTTCPVCGKAHIPDYKSNDVTCPQCGTDLSVFRQIDQLTDDEAAELSDKFKGEDKQGNPIDHMGRLIVEDVMTIDEVSDGDFTNPTRTVGLPELPGKVSDAIGAEGRKPIIKKNIFVKNRDSHKDLTPEDGRKILKEVLYNPDLYGQNQKVKRPYNWILVHLAEKNSSVILEVNPTKDHLEIVNWHYLNGRQLEQKKRQAEREGGRILTLQESNAAGDASQGLSSGGKDNAFFSDNQESAEEKRPAVDELSDKQTESAESSDGYTIESRKDTRDNSDIFAVKFEERVSREVFKGQKAIAKKHGGYWSNFGKKGFLFKTREDAEAFANEVMGKPNEAVAEDAPVSLSDIESAIRPVEAEISSASNEKPADTTQKREKKPSKWVDDEDAEEFERLRKILRNGLGQLNSGFPPELLYAGGKMSYLMMKHGVRKFAEYAAAMIEELGDAIRPHLKALYNFTRSTDEVTSSEWADELTPFDEVMKFDTANFGKPHVDAMATAENVVAEEASQQHIEDAVTTIKDTIRQNPDGSISQTINESGTEIEVTEGDFIPGVRRNNGKAEWTGQTEEPKKKKSQKKTVSSQSEQPGLFGGFFTEQSGEADKFDEDVTPTGNDIRRNDAVSTQRLPSDNSGQSEGNRENPRTQSQRTRQESERTDRGREESGAERTRTVRPRLSRLTEEGERRNQRNNRAERGTDYAPKGEDARIKANIAAIELAQRLTESGDQATPEQMEVLRKFSGWGGLGKAFSNEAYAERIRKLLGDSYQDAVDSRKSAYYTPAAIIDSLWDIAKAMGFQGGTILEGSAGIGNILGLMPEEISERSNIHAVEVDSTTGSILSLLYPDAQVDIQGFEETRIENGSVDLAITNVPFITGWKVIDKTGDKDLSKKFKDIHDYCIAKNIRKLREGGIGIFITSSGTLDNSAKLRAWVTNEGNSDVVGAFRLHKETFGGTGATSDIIVVRKRVNGKKSAHAIDVSEVSGVRTAEYDTGETKTIKVDGHKQEIPVVDTVTMDYNRYFVEHPEQMAGEMHFGFEKGDTYRAKSKALYPVKGKNQEAMLSEWAQSFSGMDFDAAPTDRQEYEATYDTVGNEVKVGSMIIDDRGRLCVNSGGVARPLMSARKNKQDTRTDDELISMFNSKKIKGRTRQQCLKDYNTIKKALADVLEYQTTHEDNDGLEPLLTRLNAAFDSFVSRYGNLHKNNQLAWLRNDVDYPGILALETYEERGDESGNRIKKFGKTDIFSRRVVEKETIPQPKNIKDGIITSLYISGRIDVGYIAGQLGISEEQVRRDIISSGLGYENPVSREMEVSYEYLSGNVREKLRQAEANNVDGRYNTNIKALEKVVPMNIPAHLIEFALGSSWIDPQLYEDYIKERTGLNVKLTNVGGTWFMKSPDTGLNTEQNRSQGVYSEELKKTVFGHEILEAAITNRSISVSRTYKKSDGSYETITDRDATQAVAAKVDEFRLDFKDWARAKMQGDMEMSARMETVYNDRFNNSVPRSIPDEFIPKHFGGQVSEMGGEPFSLRPHQAKAVIRGTTQSQLLAHEVGTGKTFTLISTAMEMRRLGTARKPMIVVQNATVGQFVESAKALYPNAKVLTLEDADRNAQGRKDFYAKIRYNDWDMIVIPQSVLDMIPDSEERQIRFIQDKIAEKMLVLQQMAEQDPDGSSWITKQAEKEISDLENDLAKITESLESKRKDKSEKDMKKEAQTRHNAEVRAMEMLDRTTDDVENFDQMGIDALLVDEAHEYKHLGFATAMQRGIKGVDPSYSKKAQGLYLKTQAVMERNKGRNVIFATGTPISNTAAEIWTFMRYLMPEDEMRDYGIYYFDDFVRNFGNIQQMLEFGTNGKFKENNRFAGYFNLPELVRIWSTVTDTVLTREAEDVSDKIPEMEGGKAQDIYLPQTKALRSVMLYVKSELDRYDKMTGKDKKANSHIPLTMYGIAKAAAVDARLVYSDAADEPQSKTNEAVRQTLRSLEEASDYKGTVAIFADNYQNKQSGFNLYEDIRRKLIEQGVPAEQIVVMKSGMTVKKKLEIFDKVNAGEVRVILGSTYTLGTGVNIQERLYTLIHLDAPNRPMDYTQRNGRILRQGNLHKDMGIPVRVLRFGVEDSLDVTAYQRLKTKGAIADSIMNGSKMMENSMEIRSLEEDEDVFGDITAQLSGSEYAMLKNQAEKEVRKLNSKLKQWEADQTYIHNQIPRLNGLIRESEKHQKTAQDNLNIVRRIFPDGTFKTITIGKQTFSDLESMNKLFTEHNKSVMDVSDQIRDNKISGPQTRKLTIDIDGLKFEITTVIDKEIGNNGGNLFSKASRKITYSCPELQGVVDIPVSGARLKGAVEDIVSNLITGKDYSERVEAMQSAIDRNQSELQQIEQRKDNEFEFYAELEEAKARLEEYTEKMKAELAEKEAKYADMDAGVEAASEISLTEEDSEETEEDDDENVRYRLDEDDIHYRIREEEPPTKTGVGYKVFVLKNGMLYPPMVANPNGDATPVGVWLDADAAPIAGTSKTGRMQVKAGGKGTQGGSGKLAYRPGWHLGVIPYALQFNRKGESGEKELFPANFVWAEVEYADDIDYQEEAMSYGYNKNGKFQHSYAGLPRLPINGAYKYRTNPNPETDPWIITGAMKVNRLLTPSEVDEMVIAAGREPQKRQNGAITDEEINDLNAQFAQREREGIGAYSDAEVSMENDPWSKAWGESLRSKREEREFARRERRRMVEHIGELADKLNLRNVEIVTDTRGLEGRKARAKGFFDKRTGKITVVIPNNVSVADVEQTLLHESVAHYGLRQLLGEHFDEFLDKVYEAAENGIKEQIDLLATRNGWNRRVATEEYLAGLAEKTDFSDRLTGWFTKVKRYFVDMLRKIGFKYLSPGSIGDNELRYILWRSYENLANPGRYRAFEWEAQDVAMKYSLGVPTGYREIEDGGNRGVADSDGLYELNERFNVELDKLTEDNADKITLNLGFPSKLLLAGGVANRSMKLYGNKVIKKMKKHGFKLSELHNLPEAVAHPIAVFNNLGRDGNRSILTELKTANGNFLVTIDLGKGGDDIDFNIVSSVFGKGKEKVISWIEKGYATYINKRKALDYLHYPAPIAETLSSPRLDSAAKIVENFENPTIKEQNNNAEGEEDVRFRDGDFTSRDRAIAAQQYERMLSRGSWQFREATQDSMLGLKSLYESVLTGAKAPGENKKIRIEEVAGYENAYLYENRMSSANNGEQHQYFSRFMKPLLESIHELCGSNELDRRILTDYMIAKHGLERNEYMRNEAAANGEETERDFAGLCGLTGEDDWQVAETVARQMVDDYEADHDTTELWENVKKATNATLEKIYLSGLISEDTYNKVLGMYDFYIPLRGWDETTSDEVYGYLTSKDGPLMGNVFKTAEGRKSKADDPIATIAMMADDAIRQGNRNIMKQRFLNFVHGNPSDLVSVNEMWLQHNDVTDEWEPVFADLQPDMTSGEVESEIAKFEAKMESLQAAEPDKYKRGRDARNIPYKVVRGNLNEHQVLVKRNGRTYVMTINGNPRAAQALNGLTNPNVETGGVIGNMLKLGEYVNRHLSAFYTTRNPDFVVSNFLRDMLYSNCMTWVKENPRYALRFHKNFGKVNPLTLRKLLSKWEKDSLSDSNYLEKMFKEFMLNGGETGYTSVKDIDGHKRAIAKELKKISKRDAGHKAWYWLGGQLDLLNRSAENCARFAAFLTSREMGRTLDRSIHDAKEVSVNFNKKGSGGKFVNATGQKFLGKIGSYLGGGGRIAYVFWNAGIQGMTNFGRAGKRNPGKAIGGAAALFTLGYVIPLLAQMLGGGDGDDDEKNAYYNLPEYVRRSNICFKAGEQWITIPLPIEYRAIYGMGELACGVISGNERYSNSELTLQIASQISQVMPLDMLEGGGGISPFIPSAFKPMTEAYVMNKGWTGLPVYKDTPFNKNDPEWTKAYQSADQHLVGFTKWLNETTGGDDYKKGILDMNPAKLEYLLNGTFGGIVSFPMKIKKGWFETPFGDREFEWRTQPFFNRVVKSGDERTANRKLQNEYFKYLTEYEETNRLRKKYENAADDGILGYAERVDFLYNSAEYLRFEIFEKYKPDIDAIREGIKEETNPEIKKELQGELFSTMRELVDELHSVDK